MKLTPTQLNALYILKDSGGWLREGTGKIHGNTLRSLLDKDLVTKRLYPDGWHWEIGYKGREILSAKKV